MFAYEIGSGTPVVLLHGFGLDHQSLLPLEPIFEKSLGWRRIYLHLPGVTQSSAGGIDSSQGVADAVVVEISAHVGDESFAVLGNSFGGMIARYVAHKSRSRVLGLATIAGVFVAPHAERTVPTRTVLHHEPEVVSILGTALKHYREDAVVESVSDARAFLQHVLPGVVGADAAALERIARSYSLEHEPEDRHPEPFTQPTLLITGRQDDVVGYAGAWDRVEHYPRASFAVLDGAGHKLLFERSALCALLIEDWLARVRRGY